MDKKESNTEFVETISIDSEIEKHLNNLEQQTKKTYDNRAIKVKLANLTSSNPKDLCIKARLTRETIDLSRYFSHDVVINFLNNYKENLIFNKNLGTSDAEYYLDSAKTPDDFLNYLENNEITISEFKRKEIYSNFEQAKLRIIQSISSNTISQKRKFDAIIKKNKTIVDNTGVYSLYIATNFFVGTTKNGTLLNSPIILYPVELTYNQGSYTLKHLKRNFIVNEKLLTLLKKEYNLNWIVSDIAKLNDFNEIIEIIRKDLNIPFKLDSYPNHEFKEYTNIELSKIHYFTVYDSYIIGIYEPTGGALKENLETLVEMNIDPFISQNEYSENKFINQEINGEPLIEIGRPLNIYQKYAIRSSLHQNTLIYGPPGTGKSEVIANIIANAIINLKSVLVVSEKKAALKVLHERLQDISKLALFIYDLDDKTNFYNKIANIGENILNMRFDEENTSKFNLKEKIETSNKWQKVQNSHLALRKYIDRLVNLNKEIDSLGTNFNDYINANCNIDKKLLKYAKETNIISFIEKTMKKYSFVSVDNFFGKFNEYKEFLLVNGISESNVTNELKNQKLIITQYQLSSNLLQYIIENESYIVLNLDKLKKLINSFNLSNDQKFKSLLISNPDLLKIQQEKTIEFIKNYPSLFENHFFDFLIDNYDAIPNFLNKYNKADAKNKTVILNNFLSGHKFNKFNLFNKKNTIENDYSLKLSAIKFFSTIPHARYKYLSKLVDNTVNYIDRNLVIIYNNQWMAKPYIKELGNKNFTFFDDEDLIKLTPIREMDAITFQKFKLIINFEKEVLYNHRDLLNIDINEVISSDRQLSFNATNNAATDVEAYYLEYLRTIFSQISSSEWNKIQEVFSIARRNAKKNVSIKDYVQKYYKQLSIIFPIWISLPELVAQILPLEKAIFNYGIFDEASQMFVERAYPIVYRCETNIVAGDDKQLKPTSFFTSRINDTDYEYELADNDQVDSLLDRAKVSLWASYNLRNHYRSNHRDLIQFSNDYVYNNKLNFATKNGINKAGISVINVDGISDDSINEKEANVVINLLEDNIDKYKKIIVITFGNKQSVYIEQLIFKTMGSSNLVYKKFLNGNLIITNLENVQGNEADLVILSTTFAKNKDGIFKNAYGPLISDGGINRLNVAITRAKEKMIVVKSIKGSEMNINHNNYNALVLKAFFEYCDKLNHQINTVKNHPNEFVNTIFKNEIGSWLNSVIYTIKNLELIENYDIGSKIIDFAIIDKETRKVELAIIVNQWSNSISIQSYLESIDNYFFFIDRGYNSYRLEEFNWVYNNAEIKKQIIKAIESINSNDYYSLD